MGNFKGQITNAAAAMKYFLAGKAFVTLRSLASGTRFTYKIELADKRKPTDPDFYFVNVLVGPDNWANYKYIGYVKNNQFTYGGEKAKITQDAPSVKGFTFCFGMISKGIIQGFEIWHEGKCGRCGRKLTVPESVADGFGPECVTLVGKSRTFTPVVVRHGTTARNNLKSILEKSLHDTFPVAVNGTAVDVRNIDAEIRRRIAEYKADAPENYYQDGELDEQQAFNVAYNKFRVAIQNGGR